MIAKSFDEVSWHDIAALKDSAREEGVSIEYKAGFSVESGEDPLALPDSKNKKNKAVDSIAEEVIAFLNTIGGDLLIGPQERSNDDPVIESINKIANVDQAVKSLEDSLADLIEPRQSLVSVKAIKEAEDATEGVVLIRAHASLRAPHRSTRSREAYARQGTRSVKMRMDEIQDMVLRRASVRGSKELELEEILGQLKQNRFHRETLPEERIHFRIAYVPLTPTQLVLDDALLKKFRGGALDFFRGDKNSQNTFFIKRLLEGQWKPVLRGKRIFGLGEARNPGDTEYASKEIYQDGRMISDYSIRYDASQEKDYKISIYEGLFLGFLANSIDSMQKVLEKSSGPTQGLLGMSYKFGEKSVFVFNDGDYQSEWCGLSSGFGATPHFEIGDPSDLTDIFEQLQIDVCNLAGAEQTNPYKLSPQ